MELSLRRLQMLRELHRRGTVTAAAQALHYSPSGVSQQLAQLERDYAMATYARSPVEFVRGEGSWLWDPDGASYLDFLAGIAVNSLGHAHPALIRAVTAQVSTLAHVSNYFATPPQIALAERLRRITGAGDTGSCHRSRPPTGGRGVNPRSGGNRRVGAQNEARLVPIPGSPRREAARCGGSRPVQPASRVGSWAHPRRMRVARRCAPGSSARSG